MKEQRSKNGEKHGATLSFYGSARVLPVSERRYIAKVGGDLKGVALGEVNYD